MLLSFPYTSETLWELSENSSKSGVIRIFPTFQALNLLTNNIYRVDFGFLFMSALIQSWIVHPAINQDGHLETIFFEVHPRTVVRTSL